MPELGIYNLQDDLDELANISTATKYAKNLWMPLNF